MMSGQIPVAVRAHLRSEAHDRCGYCQTQQALAYGPLEVDHIIPVAAGGKDDPDNLWLACRPCNQYKGVQTHGRDRQSGQQVRLFNPRQQAWCDHFRIDIVYTGTCPERGRRMRPGEKLFEELFIAGEVYARTAHQKIFVVRNGGGAGAG